MVSYWLKKLLPRTLYARFLLIIIIPTVFAQLIATYMFYERHWSNVSSHMESYFVGEICAIIKLHQQKLIEHNLLLKIIDDTMHLSTSFKPLLKIKKYNTPTELEEFKYILINNLKIPINVNYLENRSDIFIEAEINSGLLTITASRKRLDNPTTYIFILWMVGTAGLFLLLAIVFLKNQISSISKLADAVEKFGKGQSIDFSKPTGAKEVRQAGRAFLRMKYRIERQIIQRTEMLAGVSHDLRTPITRIKLQLAMLNQDEATTGMQQDVIEMEYMIKHYLDFARGEGGEESLSVNINKLFTDIIANYAKEIEIFLQINGFLNFTLKINAFKRAINNLLNNSIKYATKAKIIIYIKDHHLVIKIEDNGPGIEKSKREEVFKPFYRLDDGRNLNNGGVGLGLAITQDVINAHGGKIYLKTSKLGGLKVVIKLPV